VQINGLAKEGSELLAQLCVEDEAETTARIAAELGVAASLPAFEPGLIR
jgi:hypothetical protein